MLLFITAELKNFQHPFLIFLILKASIATLKHRATLGLLPPILPPSNRSAATAPLERDKSRLQSQPYHRANRASRVKLLKHHFLQLRSTNAQSVFDGVVAPNIYHHLNIY